MEAAVSRTARVVGSENLQQKATCYYFTLIFCESLAVLGNNLLLESSRFE